MSSLHRLSVSQDAVEEAVLAGSLTAKLDEKALYSGQSPMKGIDRMVVVIIDPRVLIRECLARCLLSTNSDLRVVAYSSVTAWQASDEYEPEQSVVLLCTKGRKDTESEIERGMTALAGSDSAVPVVVLSDVDDPDCVVGALDKGARGYIPTSVGFDVVVGAMYLIKAGGVYVPASTLKSYQKTGQTPLGSNGIFTSRQAAVVDALRQGKANKIIAYELNMCESTVKVHVRNIMKKLNAKNRTEVAYLTNGLFPNGDDN